MKFEDLKLHPTLLKAVKDQNYVNPTAIQEQAIPLILKGNDVMGSAQTGTGKTAAFAIPILQHLYLDREKKSHARKIKALIITPTRELAIQIGESFTTYGRFTGISNTVIFGGVPQSPQTNILKSSCYARARDLVSLLASKGCSFKRDITGS